ncbi:AraC family transcriptional regulator [Cohnella sp. WQ 127256]|uniref:helix-turn-helix transcriptional regulator n=1 Tax=Cohnella sp. WQ 127256 TaxID=2938790 RepID=UPI002117E1C3|nr:AraC family transcriptional regulator [Cohnella sp. WQ 127256]
MHKHIALSTISSDQFICFPESVGCYNDNPQHSVIRETGEFPNFNIHLVTRGKGYIQMDGKAHEIKKGEAFLYVPMQYQQYYSSQDDPWEVYFLHFYGEKIKEFLLEKGFYQTNLWTMNHWERLQQSFQSLIHEAETYKQLHQSLLSTLAYGIVAEFITQAAPLTPRREQSSTEVMLNLLTEIQEKACEPFELQVWADKANVSMYYFCKLFRKLTQQTPMQFITLCRIRQSKQLLIEHRTTPIAQIANKCGYPSVSYFIQRFKKQEGMTPLEYRKRIMTTI